MKVLRLLALAALLAAVACSGSRAFHDGREAESVGHWDVALLKYTKALELDPTNSEYRIALAKARMKASQFHFEKGKIYRSAGRPELAVVELQQAVALDQTNEYAQTELRKARDEAAKALAERGAESRMEAAKRKTRGMRARAPLLEPMSDRPINLNFPQPKPVKQIYQSLASAAGINVIFDPQLKDDNVSIVLTNVEFQTALETLMRQENHFYKVIDEHTMLIAADNPQNRKTYEDLVIRTFFLSNGDVTEVSNALRSLLQTTRISINKAENSITLRDTADKVAIAEKIIEQNDKQLSEVVVDVELLQINTDDVLDLGLSLVPYSVSASIPAPGGNTDLGAKLPDNTFTWDQLKQISINSFGFNIPSLLYTFIKNNTNAELLAKPQLRISEGQKAQLIIGDKVPIPTTTFNTGTTVGGNIVPVTSFQYQDVGIKIDVEPRVHHNREITMKMTVEVSQLNGFVPVQGGQAQPIIGTRTIASNIRLKDGETNFLAGLYRTDKTATTNTIPFLGDIPVLGRLLSRKQTENKSTDIILTLTPHIIRIPDVTEEDLAPVYVGTDANISFQGTPRIESPAGGGPFDFGRGTQPPPPRVTPPPATTPPGGINLAPAGPPSDIFRPTPRPTPGPGVRPGEMNAVENSAILGTPTSALFDFDPASVTLAVGERKSIIVRAGGNVTLGSTSLAIRFDPSVAAALSVRPILSNGGHADSGIEGNRIVLELPGGLNLAGTQPIAEVVLQGIKAGKATLSFDKTPDGAGWTPLAVEVRLP
jgi:general secretion pathway protein D